MFAAILEPPTAQEQPQQAQEPAYACDPLLWPHLTADERQRGVAHFWELAPTRQAEMASIVKSNTTKRKDQ